MILVFFMSFATASQYTLTASDSSQDIEELFSQALEDAKEPLFSEIAKNLTSFSLNRSDLIFDEEGRILLVFPSTMSDYPSNPELITLYSDTFFTAAHQLQDACKGFDQTRLLQFLGMAPDEDIDGVIEVYANLSDVFRPCPDPGTFDNECELSIPLVGEDAGLEDQPWYCEDVFPQQISQRTTVSNAHLSWMCERWTISFENDELYDNRPWTALGYTYDWGSDAHFGLSEFTVLSFTQVMFVGKYNISDYCS